LSKLLPTYYLHSILDITDEILTDLNAEYLIFDLDNTLAINTSYEIDDAIKEKILKFKEKYKVYLVSNSPRTRVNNFAKMLSLDNLYSAMKPFKRRLLKYIKEKNIDLKKAVMIGDQIMTDISLANKLKVKSILVDSLSRNTESIFTKFNRFREKKHFNKLEGYGKQSM